MNSGMELEKKIPKVFKAPKKCINRIPDEILNDVHLQQAIQTLPPNYNFEIEKTVWRIRSINAKLVGLQMPEGLLLYGTTIVDIIRKFTDAEGLIMADVTYGACCIDDYTAKALNVDLLIHYGHSCLIPINQMFHNDLSFLYVFVNIEIDQLHCLQTISLNFRDKSAKSIFLVSTIQFLPSLHSICSQLQENGYQTFLPQSKPLSPGEILGCTAPKIQHDGDNVIIYIGDGRFHLEAMMIANPHVDAFKYDPYTKRFTKESYDFKKLLSNRQKSLQMCSFKNGGRTYKIGLILGTLGHQGSERVLQNIKQKLESNNHDYVSILISEITQEKLLQFSDIDVFIQIACPRLSIDWGHLFAKPLLTTYEASILLNDRTLPSDKYPMDFYATSSFGEWTPNHKTISFN